MGNYNPDKPAIMGDQWAPIRNNPYLLDDTSERGYSFKYTLPATTMINTVRWELREFPPGGTRKQVSFASLYPRGLEDNVGEIITLTAPVHLATITGSQMNSSGFSGTTGALLNSSDNDFINVGVGSSLGTSTLDVWFDITSILGALSGKRILDVGIIYTAAGDWLGLKNALGILLSAGLSSGTEYETFGNGVFAGPTSGNASENSQFNSLAFGEINPLWMMPTPVANTARRLPWNVTSGIGRFIDTSPTAIAFRVSLTSFGLVGMDSFECTLQYMQLYVRYCEETRVAYGGMTQGGNTTQPGSATYQLGVNYIPIVNTNLYLNSNNAVTGHPITQGDYTVTVTQANVGDSTTALSSGTNTDIFVRDETKPTVRALRELYRVEPQRGVEIARPFDGITPPKLTESVVLPALGLTITGASNVITDSHTYSEPFPGRVYEAFGSAQTMLNSTGVATPVNYPQVRFYAKTIGQGPRNPLVISNTATPTQTTEISDADFQALPEIIDGWKEVTLRFAVPPAFTNSGAISKFQWLSFNTKIRDQWQILGADSASQTPNTTFDSLLGSAFFPVIIPDVSADYTLLFSTDPAAVSNFAVSTQSFPVTGTDPNCAGNLPGCFIPVNFYSDLTWSLPSNSVVIQDTFDRTVSNGWGTANTGQTWTTSGGAASDYSVNGGQSQGKHTHTAVNVPHKTYISSGVGDFNATILVTSPIRCTGAPNDSGIIARSTGPTNEYHFTVRFNPDGTVEARIEKLTAGVLSVLNSVVLSFTHVAGNTKVNIRAQAVGAGLFMKAWVLGSTEPGTWNVTTGDTSFATGAMGAYSLIGSGSTAPLPMEFNFDTFLVGPVSDQFGYYEIQRMDTVDPVWRTIAKISSVNFIEFRDLEARFSILSSYRIRTANSYEFFSAWSSTVTNTLLSPTAFMVGNHSMLMLSSNSQQSGNLSLAYEMVWDGDPEESMTYLEAATTQFQKMYRRDYQVAFRPTERGGVQFSRTVLTQSAALPLVALERDMVPLRDVAWDDAPYLTVRTESGDRWFATVDVEEGLYVKYRAIQTATVTVTETTLEPFPFDPAV